MNKQRKTAKQRGGTASVPDEEMRPIFSDKVSNIVPGEVLLQLDEGSAASVAESISRGPLRVGAAAGPSSFGIGALDRVLASLKVSAISAGSTDCSVHIDDTV